MLGYRVFVLVLVLVVCKNRHHLWLLAFANWVNNHGPGPKSRSTFVIIEAVLSLKPLAGTPAGQGTPWGKVEGPALGLFAAGRSGESMASVRSMALPCAASGALLVADAMAQAI
jgi:hypothetical protein